MSTISRRSASSPLGHKKDDELQEVWNSPSSKQELLRLKDELKWIAQTKSSSSSSSSSNQHQATVDHAKQRYPYAITWSPLPVITMILPFIGHMGIANSEGIIFDFAGPYTISKDAMAFGAPTRYLTLQPSKVTTQAENQPKSECFDVSIGKGCAVYSRRMHNLVADNCHSHVANTLMHMGYDNWTTQWNMVYLCFWMLFCGKFTGASGVLKTYLPSLLFWSFVLFMYKR